MTLAKPSLPRRLFEAGFHAMARLLLAVIRLARSARSSAPAWAGVGPRPSSWP